MIDRAGEAGLLPPQPPSLSGACLISMVRHPVTYPPPKNDTGVLPSGVGLTSLCIVASVLREKKLALLELCLADEAPGTGTAVEVPMHDSHDSSFEKSGLKSTGS